MFAGGHTSELSCLPNLLDFQSQGGENMIKHTQVTSLLGLSAALLLSSMAYAQGGDTTGGGATGGGTDAGGTGTATDAAGAGSGTGGGAYQGGGTDTGGGGTDMGGGTGTGGGTDMGGGSGAGGGTGGGMADTGGEPLVLSLLGSLAAGSAFVLRRKLS
jgi:hypothetical protein